MASQRDHGRSGWVQCLVLLCLACTVVIAQTVGDASSDAGSSSHSASPPSFTTPIATAPVPTIPATTAPTPTTTARTTSPATKTPTPTASAPTASTVPSSETSTPTQTTTAPAATTSPTSTRTTAPVATSTAVPSATTDTATSSPTSTTASPAVQHYNSSTLPPGVSSSVLNGSDLVSVEVTETTLGDGTTSYSYIIVTDTGETEKVVVVSPSTDGQATTSTSSEGEGNSTQSDSSSSGSSTVKASGSLGLAAIIGIVVGALVVILALFAFLVAQRRRYAKRSNDASSDAAFALPAVGKQARLLDQNQSMADTEYEDATRTLPHSQVSGVSMLSSRRRQGTMWEDPVIVASRIPIDHIELEDIISRGAFGLPPRRFEEHGAMFDAGQGTNMELEVHGN
ncbi:hypothetical protein PHYPSEUDO_008799 [Phytophthora pseudosyringae]|uniref:Uncharacterized protein n=1 Tax=Phytophthora pseudosyringae TaxID=221518 RepID=A0A8T1W9V9_9STRA|nr:hypothetical protein PHYPSEUDO_008799 [Phytophthora pseudosyringae]